MRVDEHILASPRTMRAMLAVGASLILVLTIGAWTGTGHAQSESSEARARALFTQGRAAYDAGDFDEAVTAFREAYLLSGRPALLYNIGQSELRLDNHALALEAFEGYLRQTDEGDSLRAEVEERVRVLRGMGIRPEAPHEPEDDGDGDSGEPADPAPAAEGFDPIGHRLFTWIALGVSAAAAGAAIGVYYDGVSVHDGLLAGCGASALGCSDQEIAQSGLPDREAATNALWITSGAMLAAAIVLYVVEGFTAPSATAASSGVRLDVGPGSLVLRGTF